MAWNAEAQLPSRRYTCGHCGNLVASDKGYYNKAGPASGAVYVCPYCDQPSYFVRQRQIPGVSPGNDVNALPADVATLYKESRDSVAIGAHTAAVLTCRKLLMNTAVSLGAPEGESFLKYVEYLAAAGYVPPNGRTWVDHIRKKGNEANHEIVLMSQADATDLIAFAEMLLKFIYEFPNRVPAPTP